MDLPDRDIRKLAELQGLPPHVVRRQLTILQSAFSTMGYELQREGARHAEEPAARRVVVHVVTEEQERLLAGAVFEVLAEMADYRDCGEEVSYEQECQAIVDAVKAVLQSPTP